MYDLSSKFSENLITYALVRQYNGSTYIFYHGIKLAKNISTKCVERFNNSLRYALVYVSKISNSAFIIKK